MIIDFTKDLEFTDGRPAEIEVLATDMGGERPFLLRARCDSKDDWMVFPVNERGYHLTLDGKLNVRNCEPKQYVSKVIYAHYLPAEDRVVCAAEPLDLGVARARIPILLTVGVKDE